MRFMSVIAVALLVVGAGNLMNGSMAEWPVCPPEECVLPPGDNGDDVGGIAVEAEVKRRPLCKVARAALKAPGKVLKIVKPLKVLKVVVKPVKVVVLGERRPPRRALSRLFGRRR